MKDEHTYQKGKYTVNIVRYGRGLRLIICDRDGNIIKEQKGAKGFQTAVRRANKLIEQLNEKEKSE